MTEIKLYGIRMKKNGAERWLVVDTGSDCYSMLTTPELFVNWTVTTDKETALNALLEMREFAKDMPASDAAHFGSGKIELVAFSATGTTVLQNEKTNE